LKRRLTSCSARSVLLSLLHQIARERRLMACSWNRRLMT
jgi:hypothetical protein